MREDRPGEYESEARQATPGLDLFADELTEEERSAAVRAVKRYRELSEIDVLGSRGGCSCSGQS